ncbi:MAG: hypothetical protein AABX50_01460 [Nanoarchaeota archaeon]
MLEQTSKKFREDFLLKLTKEILEHTQTYRNLTLKNEVQKVIRRVEEGKTIVEPNVIELEEERREEIKKEEMKQLVAERIKEEFKKNYEIGKKDLSTELKTISRSVSRPVIKNVFAKKIQPFLRIPEPRLPETARHIRPQATREEIDLGKINALIRDPLVKVIECNGQDENIIVIGIMGRKKTPITLNKEEMEQILQTFSQAAKIPVHEGLFKAAVGTAVISAVVSDIAGIKFVIRKISQEFSYQIE